MTTTADEQVLPTPAEDTYVETRMVPVADLHPFPGNANQGDVGAIHGSVMKNGQYRALIVREEDSGRLVVLAGNNTLQAIVRAGRPHARCEIHRCDDATALRINVADNKIARLAIVDEDALLEQLSFLEGDYTGTGFDEGEVLHMLDLGGGPTDDGHETYGLTAEEAGGDGSDPDDAPTGDDDGDDGDDGGPEEKAPAPGSADLLERPDEDKYHQQYGVIVVCSDEESQAQVYDELHTRGYNCRVVTV